MTTTRIGTNGSAAPPPPIFIRLDLIEDHAREMAAQMRLSGRTEQADEVAETLANGGVVSVEMHVDQAVEMAIALHRTGRQTAAEKAYKKVLKASPGHARGRHFYGLLLHQTKRSDEGLRQMRRSLEALQDMPWAWNNLGNIEKQRGDNVSAEASYRKALELSPDFAEAHCNLGVILREQEKWQDADACYVRALELRNDYPEAWFNRGKLMVTIGQESEGITMLSRAMVLGVPVTKEVREMLARAHSRLGDLGKAAEIYREWIDDEPDNPAPRFLLAACLRENEPTRAPDDYVATHFDEFASTFDRKLALLKYRAPELVVDALLSLLPAGVKAASICDAGCGTGLCGPLLAPATRRLVGVDLSGGMLAEARKRNIYDELVEAELTEFLAARPNTFDGVASADTLCYFGALEDFAAAAYASLRPGGALSFTVEALLSPDDPPHRIWPNGRYSHRADYVEAALAGAGFRVEPLRREVLRHETGEPVQGFVVAARREA